MMASGEGIRDSWHFAEHSLSAAQGVRPYKVEKTTRNEFLIVDHSSGNESPGRTGPRSFAAQFIFDDLILRATATGERVS